MLWRQLRHPHILPFYGVIKDLFPNRLCIVSPWMDHGNIMAYVKTHPGRETTERLLYQAAMGMDYLHSLKILHGDIKGVRRASPASRSF